MTGRRRFLSIVAGAGALALPGTTAAKTVRWQGTALGAPASITIADIAGTALVTRVITEIDRLENVFSLFRSQSALVKLNRDGRLDLPPLELTAVLSLCDSIHRRTGGAFDPTVQALWRLHADAYAAGRVPGAAEIDDMKRRTGWSNVAFGPRAVRLSNGAQLTLNGIAQGYVADRVADILQEAGIGDVLIDMGEVRALGVAPGGGPWRAGIAKSGQPALFRKRLQLSDQALATSEPLGTTFDAPGLSGHILDPRTGTPGGRWSQVSVVARTAALADGLSTAFCLMSKDAIAKSSSNVDVHLA